MSLWIENYTYFIFQSFFRLCMLFLNDQKARNVDILHQDGWGDLKNILTQSAHTKSSTDEKQAVEPVDYLYSLSFLKRRQGQI